MSAAPFRPACKVDDLRPGTMRAMRVGKTQLVIARIGDEFFAFAYFCPHMRFPLSIGKLNADTCTVTCALHHSEFSLRNGEVVHWSTRMLTGGPLLGLVVTP